MKRIIILLALLALPFIAFAQTDDAASKDDRPSVAHGSEKIKYMGSATLGIDLLGFFLHTSHGAFFPKDNLYAGLSVEYSMFFIEHHINIAAHGRWFYPEKKKVQGYIGVEAGVSVLLPSYINAEEPTPGKDTNDTYYQTNAGLHLVPSLGMVINFNKVSLDIGIKYNVSPLIIEQKGFWAAIPAVGIGLIF